jgi:nucleolar protein 58
MLVLFETPAGYALFRISDEKKLSEPADIASLFSTPELSQKK